MILHFYPLCSLRVGFIPRCSLIDEAEDDTKRPTDWLKTLDSRPNEKNVSFATHIVDKLLEWKESHIVNDSKSGKSIFATKALKTRPNTRCTRIKSDNVGSERKLGRGGGQKYHWKRKICHQNDQPSFKLQTPIKMRPPVTSALFPLCFPSTPSLLSFSCI